MRLTRLVVPTVGLLVVGLAAPASAAVTVTGASINGDASDDLIIAQCTGAALAAVGAATTGAPCATLDSVGVDAREGADTVDLGGLTAAEFPALTQTSTNLGIDASVDQFSGSPVADFVSGSDSDRASGLGGDDAFTDVGTALGGAGDDVFQGAYRYASGGPGDDRFLQFTAIDGIEGGEGYDSWEADFDEFPVGTYGTLTFTMDGAGVTLSDGTNTNAAAINGVEHLEVTTLRQAGDTWQGGAFPGSQNVRTLSGNDRIIGGTADDVLNGGVGDDSITGGPGEDVLIGGTGNDTIAARDAVADVIDCGDGADSVVADLIDSVTGCESVDVPPVVVVPPTPPAPPPAAAPETGTITGPATIKAGKKGRFAFSAAGAGATYECRLDRAGWLPCSSPHKIKTKKLKKGKHRLFVRAFAAGLVDPTPSLATFKVVSKKRKK